MFKTKIKAKTWQLTSRSEPAKVRATHSQLGDSLRLQQTSRQDAHPVLEARSVKQQMLVSNLQKHQKHKQKTTNVQVQPCD
jgi:hypothetical protein